jgi:predicted N-acetyltransferase YhbS
MNSSAPRIETLTAADFAEAMDFLNMVFSMTNFPHDFARQLPLLYRPTDDCMRCLLALRDGGRIRATAGVFPMDWMVGGEALKVVGIGGVAVHPADRGKGYMKALMTEAAALASAQGAALSWLSGGRIRYRPFGYETAGTCFQFAVSGGAAGDAMPALRFDPLRDDMEEMLTTAMTFYERLPMHMVRTPGEFRLRCRAWSQDLWLARRQDGAVVGYLVAGTGNTVAEAAAHDAGTAVEIVRAWATRQEHALVDAYPCDPDHVTRLAACAESVAVRPSGNWLILDWPRVLGALLRLRAAAGPLPDGEAVIEISGTGVFSLTVDGGRARCVASDRPADLTTDPLTAVRLLGGPLRPSETVRLSKRAAILDAWCPLPLTWRRPDMV